MGFALIAMMLGGCQLAFGLSNKVSDAPSAGDGVVAHYPMDELPTTGACLVDASGHDRNGACLGDPLTVVTGQIGNGFSFDGRTRIQIPSTPSLAGPGPFTFAGWFQYSGSLNDTGCPFNRPYATSGDADSWQVCLDPGLVTYYLFDTQPVAVTVPWPMSDAWHHYAIVFTGTDVTTYIDGGKTSSTPAKLAFDESPLQLGQDLDGAGPTSSITGALDDIWIYDRALSASEILKLESP